MELYCTAASVSGCTRCEFFRALTKIYARYLDVAAVLDASDVDTAFGAVFGLYALAPADSLCLDSLERVERLELGGTIVGGLYHRDRAVAVECELLYGCLNVPPPFKPFL